MYLFAGQPKSFCFLRIEMKVEILVQNSRKSSRGGTARPKKKINDPRFDTAR